MAQLRNIFKRAHAPGDTPTTYPLTAAQNEATLQQRGAALLSSAPLDTFVPYGYRTLDKCPEIQMAVDTIADVIGSMTIYLMTNTADGDRRIKNELSRKIDIEPCKFMTRSAFMHKIARDLVLCGDSYVLPHIDATTGYLDDLQPLSINRVSVIDDPSGYGYHIVYGGKRFEHDEILHFVLHPDDERPWKGRGTKFLLSDVAERVGQARKTSTALMKSPAPSLIVKVDGLTEDFKNKEGRAALRSQYIDSSENGVPWFIPCEAFEVEKVAPLNLNDLAVIDSIKLDKCTVAALVGVPAFLLGEGRYNKDEYNSFIKCRVLPIATAIVQELTLKLLTSSRMYLKFNPRSLYAYSLKEVADIAGPMVDRAVIDRNEARDWLAFVQRDGLSDLAILENYIPYDKIGDQKKLKEKEAGSNGTT